MMTLKGKSQRKTYPVPNPTRARQLYDVEQIFLNAAAFKTSIVRFGGLYGDNRNPVKFLAGRKDLSNGSAPVNLIHREDCIGILLAIIQQDAFGHIFNAVSPEHPTKQAYYHKQAELLNLQPPEYKEDISGTFKQVDSEHLSKVLAYDFKKKL